MSDDEKTLGTYEKFGPLGSPIPLRIKPNNKKICLDCGIKITRKNDSGWEGFLEDGITTQPLCKNCDANRGVAAPKANDDVLLH